MNPLDAKKLALQAVRRMRWPALGDIVLWKDTAGPTHAFYQVIRRTKRSVVVQMIDEDISIEGGNCVSIPLRDEFVPTDMWFSRTDAAVASEPESFRLKHLGWQTGYKVDDRLKISC